ncbi:MAG: YegS/Rv2252/BmrU family lipid kinase [Candidatus Eremiobacteraeota bacterium]|nr:YegS/Rv2252/BmrU family lipid kinase [Candidatus Eremiobacteraeota bacterium]
MSVFVVVNEHSSGTQKCVEALPGLLAERHIGVESFEVVAHHKAVRRLVKRAVKAGAEIVIVGGGDGTMTATVDVLAHKKTTLGVLPLGTGNSFAKTLSVPDDVAGALDVIAAGRSTRVDLGTADGRHFANFATIGLSSEVAEAAPHALKPIIGPLTYVVGGIVPFMQHRPFRVRVRFDDGKTAFVTHQIVVASGRYFGEQPITPDATIRDGKLAFFTTTGLSHFDVAKMYIAMGLGQQTHLRDAVSFSSTEIVVKTKPKQPVSLDGHEFGSTPVRFGIAPRALRVFVPAAFADAPA